MKSLAAALVEAQKKMPVVHRTATANTGTYQYSYVTLDQLIEKTKPVLTEQDLVIAQFPSELANGGPGLRTVLMHGESGEQIEATVPLLLNGKHDMQTLGGAITYARRYGWAAVLGIANEEDDDAAAVSAPGTGATQASTTPASASAGSSGTGDGVGGRAAASSPPSTGSAAAPNTASVKQQGFIKKLLGDNGFTIDDLGKPLDQLTKADASQFIEQLQGGTFNPASLAAAGGGYLDDDIPFEASIDGLGG